MEIRQPKQRFGEILVEMGAITNKQLEEALIQQKKTAKRTGEILLDNGIITEEVLIAALGKQLGIPYIDISQYLTNSEAFAFIELSAAREQNMVIFDQDNEYLYVATSDPLNFETLRGLEKKSGKKLQLFLTRPSEIAAVLARQGGS